MYELFLATALILSENAVAPPGEAGGAYGGGTAPNAGEVSFEEADRNGDGVLSIREARNAGIEQFELADRNRNGLLDQAEFAAFEEAAEKGKKDAVP